MDKKGDGLIMNILESIIYGLIMGITEFLPISSQGHQTLMGALFGVRATEPLRDIFVHIAVLIAILISNGTYLDRIRREMKLNSYSSGRRKAQSDRRIAQELRLIKGAAIPMLMLLFISIFTAGFKYNLGFAALFFLINGIILYLPEHIGRFQKDAGQMSGLDGFLLGIFSALSVFPGISRIGAGFSYSTARGADGNKAYQWVLTLSVVALPVLVICDIVGIFFTGVGTVTFLGFLGYLLSAGFAFLGALLGIRLMKRIIDRSSCSLFGFYCWGAALLSFLLHQFS